MQTTLGNMLDLISGPFQKKVTANRAFLLKRANRIRQNFYNLYREYEMEVDVTECFEVQGFRQCGLCCEAFTGLTLPAYMNAVEAVYVNQQPINLYSKWREAKVGLKGRGACFTGSYDVPGYFPTERDICNANGSYLVAEITNQEDNGKSVEITYTDPSGRDRREALQLSTSGGIATTDLATGIKSVVLPVLAGTLVLRERCTGRILSEYLPYESVPSYKRIKLTGVCAGSQVVITANRKYHPVYWDTDVVETDNQEAIINAAYHIFYADSGSGGDNIAKAEYHRNLMRDALRGETARDNPVNRENDTGRFGPPVRRSRLWRGGGVA